MGVVCSLERALEISRVSEECLGMGCFKFIVFGIAIGAGVVSG